MTSPIYFPCADCSKPFACKVLDGLCPDCYRSNVVKPLSDAVFVAQTEYGNSLDLVYKVEIALGWRPVPAKNEKIHTSSTTDSRRQKVSSTNQPDEDDFSI